MDVYDIPYAQISMSHALPCTRVHYELQQPRLTRTPDATRAPAISPETRYGPRPAPHGTVERFYRGMDTKANHETIAGQYWSFEVYIYIYIYIMLYIYIILYIYM